jgi:hypothetical protein
MGYVARAARERGLAAARFRVFAENPASARYARIRCRIVAVEAHSATVEQRPRAR